MRKSMAGLLLAMMAVGCITPGTQFVPMFQLTEVQRPASARDRYGEQVVSRVASDSGATKYAFEDGLVKIVAVVAQSGVLFELTNKSQHSVRLVWDEATMVLPEGSPSAVMHTGIRYVDCRSPKTPSVVPSGVTLSEGAFPCNRLSFGYDWTQAPLLEGLVDTPYTLADSTVEKLVRSAAGKKISLLLPLQIEGVTNEYTLTFLVDSVGVIRPGAVKPAP